MKQRTSLSKWFLLVKVCFCSCLAMGDEKEASDTTPANIREHPPGMWVALSDGDAFGTGQSWSETMPQEDEVSAVSDCNGDGKDDIVIWSRGKLGEAWVCLSAGQSFEPRRKWGSGVCFADEIPSVGDFNGDGKGDIISWTRGGSGDVWICLSTGNSFGTRQKWAEEACTGEEIPGVGDFNGDGRDDIVSWTRGALGDAWVNLSTGHSFGSNAKWQDWTCAGREIPAVADFNGDGKDDLISFSRGERGDAWVNLSTGAKFNPSQKWNNSIFHGTEFPGIGDFDGDGKADVASFTRGIVPRVHVYLSAEHSLLPGAKWTDAFCPGNETPAVGDFNGDGKADIVSFSPGNLADALGLLSAPVHQAGTSEIAAINSVLPYKSRLWSTSEDYSRNAVQAVAQTSDGFLWIGTQGGLARFDGGQFEFIDINSLPGSQTEKISALCAGNHDDLWVGTARGLHRLKDGIWKAVSLPSESDSILALQRSTHGSIWIGTRSGLYRGEGDSSQVREMELGRVSSRIIRSMAENEEAVGWVSVADELVSLTNGVPASKLAFGAFRPEYIRSVCCARDGSIWAGSNFGLIRFKEGRYTHFTKTHGLPDNTVTAVYQDRRGNLWIGTYGGLCRFANGGFIMETTASGEPYNQVFCFFEDREENLWIGCKDGLFQLNIQQFTTYTTRHGLAHNNVISVYEDAENAMWIGTWGGGLHRLKDGKMTIYSTANAKLLRNDLILSIHGSRAGGLWFSEDYDGGLYQLKKGELERYDFAQGVARQAIRALHEDEAGRLLIATAYGSLHMLEQGRVKAIRTPQNLPTNSMRCLLPAGDDSFWVGTDAGLCLWTREKVFIFNQANGLSDGAVLSLYRDQEQSLWIGTGRGLCRMRDKGTDRFHISRFPFSDEAIVEILQDDLENLWLATKRGVLRVNKRDLTAFDADPKFKVPWTLFEKADGMASQVCVGVAKPSAFKSKDGRLWFATTKGLAVTDPKLQIAKNEKPPFVVIQQVIADQRRVGVRGANVHIKNHRSFARDSSALNLPPGRGELEFHYTALSYTVPEKNRFRYKLEGLDRDWVDAGERHVAFFNNVPPGHYMFRVTACNNDGVWNPVGSSVKVSLLPHYWQTWWFKTLLLGAGISCVGMSVRYATKRRMHRTLERLEQQHAVEKERTRIARDMHDELGARLTEILLLNDRAQTAPSREKQSEAQAAISEVTRDIGQNLNALVWAVSPRHDSLEKTVLYLWHYADKFFAKTNIHCRFDIPKTWPQVSISSETRHNLFLVLKEAANNIVKHAEASEVQVKFTHDDRQLSISISDNGKGLVEGDTSALGNGLENMKRRMESVGGSFELASAPAQGTRIRLETPLRGNSR
jgi:ligand-binding sensor domain-containing protein/signal transduction histidine kinase